MHSICCLFLLTAENKANMKIISSEIMQPAEKSYSTDMVIISRHINIPNITLFS